MATLLVTGFTVFNGYQVNPSEEAALSLHGASIAGHRVVAVVLPVSLARMRRRLEGLLERLRPDAVLGLGLSPRVRAVTLELAAASLVDYPGFPDEDGYRADLELIDRELRVLPTRIPFHAVKACRARGHPVAAGLTAGGYLCNAAAYIIHRYAWNRGVPGGFLHLPPSTTLAMRAGLRWGMPQDEIIRAVCCMLEEALGGRNG